MVTRLTTYLDLHEIIYSNQFGFRSEYSTTHSLISTPETIREIDEVKHVKYLLILIEPQLTFKYHIDELNKNVSRAIGILYKLRPFATSKALSNVYNAIIYSVLLYGIEVWGNTNITLLEYSYLTENVCSNGNL